MSLLGRIDRWIAAALDVVAVVTSLALTGLLLLLVLTRYVLGWNFSEAHDLSLLVAMFLYMTGALVASRRLEHLTVDFVPSQLSSRRAKLLHRALIAAITSVICLFFVYWTYKMLAWGFERPQTTPALRMPLWVPQISIMAASIGCLAYGLRDLRESLRELVATPGDEN